MSPGFPTSNQFSIDRVKEYVVSWNFHRDHDTEGHYYGQDMKTSDDTALVGYITNIELEHLESGHHTKGVPDIYMLKRDLGLFQIPIGVHVGQRLEPECFCAGASFKGNVVMKIVSLQDWLPVAVAIDMVPKP